MGKAEEEYGVAAEYAVVAHLVLAEVHEHRQRPGGVNEKGYRIQHPLFEHYRKAGDVYAYVAYEKGYAGENRRIYVVAVAQHYAVLAVVLYEQRYGDCGKIFVLTLLALAAQEVI